jgi:hypothetical protein
MLNHPTHKKFFLSDRKQSPPSEKSWKKIIGWLALLWGTLVGMADAPSRRVVNRLLVNLGWIKLDRKNSRGDGSHEKWISPRTGDHIIKIKVERPSRSSVRDYLFAGGYSFQLNTIPQILRLKKRGEILALEERSHAKNEEREDPQIYFIVRVKLNRLNRKRIIDLLENYGSYDHTDYDARYFYGLAHLAESEFSIYRRKLGRRGNVKQLSESEYKSNLPQ